jgi:hypothetical protein
LGDTLRSLVQVDVGGQVGDAEAALAQHALDAVLEQAQALGQCQRALGQRAHAGAAVQRAVVGRRAVCRPHPRVADDGGVAVVAAFVGTGLATWQHLRGRLGSIGPQGPDDGGRVPLGGTGTAQHGGVGVVHRRAGRVRAPACAPPGPS